MKMLSDTEHPINEITPTVVDDFGKMWRQDVELIARAYGDDRKHAAVGSWILFCPKAHPFWSYYLISLVHLREVDGVDPPVNVTGTHEVIVIALNPEKPVEMNGKSYWLEPINAACQFVASSDNEAKERVERAVVLCTKGELSPDSDYRRAWHNLFNTNPPTPSVH